ncbi:MAG: HEAT repeat domain-containing protein [Sphingomicrobium sp.]
MLKLGLDDTITQWRVAGFAADNNLVFYDKVLEGPNNPQEVIWATRDGLTSFHFIDDPIIGLKYLTSDGPRAQHIGEQAHSALPALTLKDALRRLGRDESEEERLTTISLIGLLAPATFDPEIMEVFTTTMNSPSIRVRRHAILAASYAGWPELRALFAKVRREDTDPGVRDRAEVAIQAFSNLGVAQTDS